MSDFLYPRAAAGLLLGILGLAAGCSQPKVDPDIPPALNFVLLDAQGQNLLTSTATPISVAAVNAKGQPFTLGSECQGGGCTMVRQAYSTGAAPKYSYYYSTLDAPISSMDGVKDWYISLAGKTDTLHLDVQHATYRQVRFNGQDAAIDPGQQPVYVFRRRR